ncbi:MerR family transcriptional regulator [Lactobacillus sp. M0390]|uniref:MerR family transcriptional regulator n=1 Tax=Lactobacillus sp. M0390 TaxID=2751026 RepID=UPI0018DEBAE7|nr:MerR family transcriptional regulator [Lactobacillus sp. M0390]MBH9985981.1 MerR family transcriptional regulator [Lactobacillus sp. M0390]
MTAKEHYRIGQFSELTHLTPSTLRYYEQEELLVPKRDKAGQRYYTDDDLSWLEFVLHLKGTGMTIPQLKEYILLRAQGDATIPQRLALLKEVQTSAEEKLLELKSNMKVLGQKIDWYQAKQDHRIADNETFAAYLKQIGETKNDK